MNKYEFKPLTKLHFGAKNFSYGINPENSQVSADKNKAKLIDKQQYEANSDNITSNNEKNNSDIYFQKGYNLALKELSLKYEQQIENLKKENNNIHNELLNNLNSNLSNLNKKNMLFLSEEKKILYNLIISISKKLSLQEISNSSKNILQHFVEEVFENIKAERLITITVNSKMKNYMVNYIDSLKLEITVNIIEDNNLSEIDCIIDWNSGKLECLMKNRLDYINELLVNNID